MFVRKTAQRGGFTLIEIIFTMTLVVVLAGLSLWTLQPGNSKAPTRGLATALAEEFGAARQLAISSGRPVALGIPKDDGSPVASSIYRLEGWNTPTVTWSKGFSGDYPECGFAAAKWSGGGTWSNGADESVVSKIGAFNLATWIPDQPEGIADDYLFCFTPDGGLVTNDMPALDGRYVILVGQYLDGTATGNGATINAAREPITIFVSPYGAVETVTGMPGSSVPNSGGSTVKTSEPVKRTSYKPGEIRLSNIKVLPNLDSDTGYCVPGQFVTLEVYAYDPEGRGLFAKWKQGEKKGIFTYPDGGAEETAVLVSEVDRMEFVNKVIDNPDTPEDDVTWTNTDPPTGGLFRARWAFTVPVNSAPGTEYEIEVDVKDAKGECTIVNKPDKITMRVAPAGRIIAEMFIGGVWQFVQIHPDGTNPRGLSKPGVEETLASIDDNAQKMAFLQGPLGNRFVKLRSLDGAYERTLAGPGNYTSVSISPNGTWVSYRLNTSDANGTLITENTEGGNRFTIPQTHGGSVPNPPRSRSGWTKNSRFLIYEQDTDVHWRLLEPPFTADGILVGGVSAGIGAERLYAPTTYVVADGTVSPPLRQERCMISLGNNDPVLISVPVNGANTNSLSRVTASTLSSFRTAPSSMSDNMMPDLNGSGGGGGSGSTDDSYPNITSNSGFLVLTRAPQDTPLDSTSQTCSLIPLDVNKNYVGGPLKTVNLPPGLRRAIWIPDPTTVE